jgi:3-deoxy-D-manno-octulosonate 8-phosphate phosphatase (KDO 8-P phosphatase)
LKSEIRCVCLDVDGVLTDGRMLVDEEGRPLRAFHIQDGLAIRWFQRLGGTVVILTGKQSQGVQARARELGIQHVIQNSEDKLADLTRLLDELKIPLAQTAMIGDDLPDLPVMMRCGYPIAVANGVAEVRHIARFVTDGRGGEGAAREAIEHLLKVAGRWHEVVDHYRAQAGPGPEEGNDPSTDGKSAARAGTEAAR